jgi:hypothetical protein
MEFDRTQGDHQFRDTFISFNQMNFSLDYAEACPSLSFHAIQPIHSIDQVIVVIIAMSVLHTFIFIVNHFAQGNALQ